MIACSRMRPARRERLSAGAGLPRTLRCALLFSLFAAFSAAGLPVAMADDTKPSAPEQAGANAGSARLSTLDQALAAYRAAQDTTSAAEKPAAFARAERLLAAAADDGAASAALWTNVGTAALQAEHLGTAVLAYRRALALDPDHRQARQNLAHARTLLPSWVPRPEEGGFLDSFLAWRHALSPAERRGAAAVAFAIGAAMLAASIVTGSGALRAFALVPMAAWGLLVASAWLGAEARGGVIAAAETVARAADSRNAPVRFAEPLPAGTEVAIAEVRGDWTRIVLADGRDAWVAASAVEAVDAPRAPN